MHDDILKENIKKHYSSDAAIENWKTRFSNKDISGFLKIKQLKLFKKLFKNIKNKKILDIACGNGAYSIFLAKNNKVIGLDISPGMIKISKELAKQHNISHNFKGIVGDAEKLPFKDNEFDIVLCMDTLHHFTDKRTYSMLKEFNRVTKPKGLFLTDFKNKKNPLVNIMFRKRSRKEFLLIARTQTKMKKLLNGSGFKVIKTKGIYLPVLPPYKLMISKNNRKNG